ncbi:acetylxylan esterase [Ruania halotolerans]|uniref:acetylxylan esterase n=1 Tax=Ruania halotolerans TaxID=2897773 RepID=UPI001E310713|nr:acetylxylan esterase [Ruania halotolerans]UFU05687.1 acetylxylan esterase [Ruania halotolerans]
MALTRTDLPLEDLRAYSPDLPEPADLEEFWAQSIASARAHDARPQIAPVGEPFRELIVEDLEFAGFAGDPIRGWITRPRGARSLPTVVEFVGYGGGRGLPGEKLAWAAAGFVHVLMDTRGQGSGWGTGGDTPDPHGAGPATPGFMTRGILAPEDYYYRRVFTDAVRLVDHVVEMPCVDPRRIAVTGASQGGGIAIAAAALSEHVAAVLPDVPFLCDFPRAITRTPEAPFTEIARFLSVHRDQVEAVTRTLSYFDGAVLARRIEVPALFSVALMDEIVLPSTVFAAYNRVQSADKHIEVYGFNGHEGGAFRQWHRQVEWLRSRL